MELQINKVQYIYGFKPYFTLNELVSEGNKNKRNKTKMHWNKTKEETVKNITRSHKTIIQMELKTEMLVSIREWQSEARVYGIDPESLLRPERCRERDRYSASWHCSIRAMSIQEKWEASFLAVFGRKRAGKSKSCLLSWWEENTENRCEQMKQN